MGRLTCDNNYGRKDDILIVTSIWKKCVSAQKEKYCPKTSVQNSQGGGQFEMCKLVKYSNIEDKMK
jgi:hypothetical protein